MILLRFKKVCLIALGKTSADLQLRLKTLDAKTIPCNKSKRGIRSHLPHVDSNVRWENNRFEMYWI